MAPHPVVDPFPRIVLSRAAQRNDGAATSPEGITDKAARKLAATLIEKGLVREIRAKAVMPVWRRDEDGQPHALIVTRLGRSTIKVEDGARTDDAAPAKPAPSTKPAESASQGSKAAAPRTGSKIAEVIALLGRPGGASLAELTSATGWLPHTTRAALTGLRKRGHGVEGTRSDGQTVYRIVTARKLAA